MFKYTQNFYDVMVDLFKLLKVLLEHISTLNDNNVKARIYKFFGINHFGNLK